MAAPRQAGAEDRALRWILPRTRALSLARVPAAALVFIVCLGVYLAGRSPSLDDWDSVNFAKAVVRFDLTFQAPHPPGYPLYVFLARIPNLFLHDPTASLTLLSALSGAAGVAFLWLLASDFGVPWLALPLAAMPLYWLSSEMALTDVPGLAFAVAATWLLARAASRARPDWLVGGCVATGLCAGVRPQVVVVPLAVLAFYTLPQVAREGRWRALPPAGWGLVGSCLLWAVPLALTLPWPDPLGPFRVQARYVSIADSLLGQPVTWSRLAARLADFGSILSRYFGGPVDGGIAAFAGLTGVVVLLAAVSWRTPLTRLALAWAGAYGVVMVLVMQPGDPRKALPVVPALLLLAGSGLQSLWGAARARLGAAGLVLTAFFALKCAPLVRELVLVPAPPEQAAVYIAERYSPEDTMIISDTSANHMQYRLPEFASYGLDFIQPWELDELLATRGYRRVIVLDRWARPPMPAEFQPVHVELFQRDPLVLPKAARVAFTSWERP